MAITDNVLEQIKDIERICENDSTKDPAITQILQNMKTELASISEEYDAVVERKYYYSAQVIQQYGIIEALSEGSGAIYVIAQNERYIIPIKRQTQWDIISAPGIDSWDYNDKLELFVNSYVHPDDRGELISLLNFEHMFSIISKQKIYYHHFRMLIDGKVNYYYVKITRVESAEQHLDGIMLTLICENETMERETLRTLSETDIMTKLYNRGTGEKKTQELISADTPGLFCIMDMDHFKSINDTLGHSVGDKVLIAFAKELKAAFRDEDIVFRLGGDEFAVFAPGIISRTVAIRILKSLIHRVNQIELPELKDIKLEVSIGATITGNPDINFQDIYNQADSSVYVSKKSAGSAITICPDEKAIVVE